MFRNRFILLIGLVSLSMLVIAAAMTTPALASPAEIDGGTGCVVVDANGNSYIDPNCTWQAVTKFDDAGNVVAVQYHDRGTLPADATKPSATLLTSAYFACGGCVVEGYYRQVITPAGVYTSFGPFLTP